MLIFGPKYSVARRDHIGLFFHFLFGQAKMAVWNKMEGSEISEPVSLLILSIPTHLRVEFSCYTVIGDLESFTKTWGIEECICKANEEGMLQLNFSVHTLIDAEHVVVVVYVFCVGVFLLFLESFFFFTGNKGNLKVKVSPLLSLSILLFLSHFLSLPLRFSFSLSHSPSFSKHMLKKATDARYATHTAISMVPAKKCNDAKIVAT